MNIGVSTVIIFKINKFQKEIYIMHVCISLPPVMIMEVMLVHTFII